jgi:tetratricopeptide (TPR) repeat protein
VGIVAEAGGGKSRLLYEFRQRLQDKRVTYLEGRCLSYGQTVPYHPLIDVLCHNCGIIETDSSEVIIEKVYLALQEVGMDAEASAPYLLQLLGEKEGTQSIAVLTPEAIRAQTFDTFRQMSFKGSQHRPLIVEIEDLHWIDNTSQDYLASFVESLPRAAVLLLTTYRPGYRPPWIEKSYATQVSLPTLSPQHAVTVVHSTRQQHALSEPLEQTIIDKAQGNPFFLEELTRAFIEQDDPEAPIDVPDTIQGVLSARIDRLPEDTKRLLQTAAVLGRDFSPRLLGAIWEGMAPLESLLAELKRLEFLYERTGAEGASYVFKHGLTQEVAYDGLLTTQRQRLHAAAGQAMERLSHEGLAERAEALAHHFTLGEIWEKAFLYLRTAGDNARQASACQEAIAFYTRAIEVSRHLTPALDNAQLLPVYEGRGLAWMLWRKLDAAIADFQHMLQLARASRQLHQEGESLCHLAAAYYHTQSDDHLPLIAQYAQEAQRLAHRLGDAHLLARSLTSQGSVATNRGHVAEAERHFAASLQISRREGYHDALPQTLRFLSSLAYWQGHFPAAIHHAQEGATIAREFHEGFHELHCLAFQSLACWSQGDYPQAFRILHEVVTTAQEQHNMFLLSRMKNHLGWFSRELGAVSRAVELNHESTDLGRTYRLPNVEISALINLGFDYVALGQPTRAASYFEPMLDRVVREAFGSHSWRWKIKLCIGLAELFYTTGVYDQALRYVEEGLTEAQRTSSQKYVAMGWALRGKIAAQLRDRDTAGVELQRAFTLADQLQSPSLLYPIAYDLGQWYESTGKEREAATLYGTATATIEQMITAVADDALRSTFRQSALVQEIYERATRLGGSKP